MRAQEFSAGAIVFRRHRGNCLFLLVYSGRHKHWGFPKGHVEKGETPARAAAREVAEEAGITRLTFTGGFRAHTSYEIISNRAPYAGKRVRKRVVYFLCETNQSDVVVDGREITAYSWLPPAEAAAHLTFEHMRRIFEKAAPYACKIM